MMDATTWTTCDWCGTTFQDDVGDDLCERCGLIQDGATRLRQAAARLRQHADQLDAAADKLEADADIFPRNC